MHPLIWVVFVELIIGSWIFKLIYFSLYATFYLIFEFLGLPNQSDEAQVDTEVLIPDGRQEEDSAHTNMSDLHR